MMTTFTNQESTEMNSYEEEIKATLYNRGPEDDDDVFEDDDFEIGDLDSLDDFDDDFDDDF